MKLNAQWKDDCQGKKDYDASILAISTRYWPRGGGFNVFDRDHPERGFQGNEARPEIKPSAHSSLIVEYADDESLELAESSFEGDTEAQVKVKVEAWAQEQMDRAVSVLRNAFSENPTAPTAAAVDTTPPVNSSS